MMHINKIIVSIAMLWLYFMYSAVYNSFLNAWSRAWGHPYGQNDTWMFFIIVVIMIVLVVRIPEKSKITPIETSVVSRVLPNTIESIIKTLVICPFCSSKTEQGVTKCQNCGADL